MPSNKPARNYLEDFTNNPKLPEHKTFGAYFDYLQQLFGVPSGTYRYYWAKLKDQALETWGGTDVTPVTAAASAAPTNKAQWNEAANAATWQYDGTAAIHTLEDALAYSKVDLATWEVERHIFNSWEVTMKDPAGLPCRRVNVQVKVWFKKRVDAGIDWQQVFDKVRAEIKPTTIPKAKGNGIGVVGTADFHFGAYVDDLLRSDKFNIQVLVQYLESAAAIVNQKQYKEVHLCLLGDFIESFTGLNHRNSWKGLGKGMYGVNSVILCYEILLKHFVQRIHNVHSIYLVSGNHDRVTSEKENDAKGEVAELLAYLFKQQLPEVNVHYHPMVLSVTIDKIQYVLTHGHLPFAQKELSKVLFDYGKQGIYNVLVQGHKHTRQVQKTTKRKQYTWNTTTVVQLDEADYRAIILPPLFTGNFYSESLGFSSSAGFSIMQNNGRGKLNYFDYCL